MGRHKRNKFRRINRKFKHSVDKMSLDFNFENSVLRKTPEIMAADAVKSVISNPKKLSKAGRTMVKVGKVLDLAGEGAIVVGTLSGQPEIVAAGAFLSASGEGLQFGGKLAEGAGNVGTKARDVYDGNGNYSDVLATLAQELKLLDSRVAEEETAAKNAISNIATGSEKLADLIKNMEELRAESSKKQLLIAQEEVALDEEELQVEKNMLRTEKDQLTALENIEAAIGDELKQDDHNGKIIDKDLQAVGTAIEEQTDANLQALHEIVETNHDIVNAVKQFNSVGDFTRNLDNYENGLDLVKYASSNWKYIQGLPPAEQKVIYDDILRTGMVDNLFKFAFKNENY